MTPSRPPLPVLLLAVALSGPLAGCAQVAETPQQVAERRAADCGQLGFTPDSEGYRLCLLLQDTNERLGYLERRLAWIESDVLSRPGWYGPRRWWW